MGLDRLLLCFLTLQVRPISLVEPSSLLISLLHLLHTYIYMVMYARMPYMMSDEGLLLDYQKGRELNKCAGTFS